jgi:hypothetical protein
LIEITGIISTKPAGIGLHLKPLIAGANWGISPVGVYLLIEITGIISTEPDGIGPHLKHYQERTSFLRHDFFRSIKAYDTASRAD